MNRSRTESEGSIVAEALWDGIVAATSAGTSSPLDASLQNVKAD